MGSERSAKARGKKDLARKSSTRPQHERILIVSEGSKTEPNYFGDIRMAYRLSSANIHIYPSELGTDPKNVVQYAYDLFCNGDSNKHHVDKGAFEHVYAVFDRDIHNNFFEALQLIEGYNQKKNKLKNDNQEPVCFHAIASVPSFELWLLLHYEDVLAPIERWTVIERLKKHIPDYDKGATGIFKRTRPHLIQAQERAAALAKKFTAHNDPEPYTGIHELIEKLIPKEQP